MRTGCNAFEGKIMSKPMSFWTEQDVLWYIVKHNLEYCSVYGDIVAVDEVGNEYDPHNLLIPGCKLKCTGCARTG
jgi:3'-phosphoadenosine 5'-phosphosulfate sulfotransferase (PAPS reductase)/FAD synthetase